MITVGQQLGGYTVLRRIGKGTIGEVFLAQHRRIARRAAIKALHPDLSEKKAALERFFLESRNTSIVRHPGIVEIFDCDLNDDGQAFVVMALLEGESLGAYLRRTGPLASDLPFLLGVFAAIAGTVAAAHEAGILHRNLKPENVFLHVPVSTSPLVQVKILDFGIAQLSRDDGGPSWTRSGLLLGTPEYMPPEQCSGRATLDERSDVYALGCMLYEAACGRPPFASRAFAEVLTAQISEAPKAPRALAPGLPPALEALVLKMLAKAPDERPASMRAVTDGLRSIGIAFEGPLEPRSPVARTTADAEGAESSEASSGAAPESARAAKATPEPAAASAPAVKKSGVAKTLVLDPDELPRTNPPAHGAREPPRDLPGVVSRRAPESVAPIEAMPGGTMVLPMGDEATRVGNVRPERRDGPPVAPRTGEPPIPAALVGGTMLLGDGMENGIVPPPRAADRRDRRERAGAEADDGSGHADGDGDGERRANDSQAPPVRRPSWLVTIGRDRPRILLAAGVVTLAATTVVIVAAISSKHDHTRTANVVAAAPPPSRSIVPETRPPTPITPASAAAVAQPPPASPDTVRIDLHGLAAGTEASVDGTPAPLPILIARGSQSHRIVLRKPDGSQRSIDVDGTRDRFIELVPPATPPPATLPPAVPEVPPPAERTNERAPKHHRDHTNEPFTRHAPTKRQTPLPKDREAITDI